MFSLALKSFIVQFLVSAGIILQPDLYCNNFARISSRAWTQFVLFMFTLVWKSLVHSPQTRVPGVLPLMLAARSTERTRVGHVTGVNTADTSCCPDQWTIPRPQPWSRQHITNITSNLSNNNFDHPSIKDFWKKNRDIMLIKWDMICSLHWGMDSIIPGPPIFESFKRALKRKSFQLSSIAGACNF